MDYFKIEGGAQLHGEVVLSGAKNAALPIMAASLLAKGKTSLRNVPRLRDIETMIKILRHLGVVAEWSGSNGLELEVRDESRTDAPYELVRTMRASVCVLGPLLARRGRAQVAMPGGCVIGPRPVKLHEKGLKALGADLTTEHGDLIAATPRLFGNEIYLGGPHGSTVLGTANVMCAAALAEGESIIEDAACEPEIAELALFLNKMGARIRGVGTKRLVIEGVEQLTGTDFEITPDRIEAGTLMAAAALTRGTVLVKGARREHLGAVFDAMRNIGIELIPERGACRVIGPERFHTMDLTTGSFPGFPTDMQAQMMVLLSLADGTSIITERIFPDRFMHIMELNRMGADIRKEGASAVIVGQACLSGAPVTASDLRASAALVLAGLVAKGTTTVNRVYHIDRGYERIEQKLAGLGANIQRLDDPSQPRMELYE